MCCCFAPRCSIIFAGVLCLIQSIAFAILAIIGISVYNCDLEVDSDLSNPLFYLYFIYFYNPECSSIPSGLNLRDIFEGMFNGAPGDFTTPFAIPVWPSSFSAAEFTYTVLSLYVGFNVAWAVSCVIVIVAAAKNVRNWFAYIPWILLAAANIVLDIVATIHYADDAIKAQTLQGLIVSVIGLDLSSVEDKYKEDFFRHGVFSSTQGLTSIPSTVMAILTGRLGVFWLLNVLFLICVLASVCLLPNKKESGEILTTNPQPEPRNHGFHNKSYIGEPHTNERGPQYDEFDVQGYSRPYVYTGGGLNRSSITPQPVLNGGPALGVAVPGTNVHSPATPPYYMELRHVQHRYHQPSASGDEYERQALNGVPVPSDVRRINGTDEQKRAPHIHRTDSDRSSQPPIKNRPPATVPFPRDVLHSPIARTDDGYLEPRQRFDNSLASADKYMPQPLRRPYIPHDASRNSELDGQRKAPHLYRAESDRPPYRPPAPTKNVRRRPSYLNEVDRLQDYNSNADRRSAGSVPSPISSLPPEELRNQLPWSYFGPRNAKMKAKAIQESVAEDELDKPPVPVPDYTLHFGKTARPVASKWSDDKSSSLEDNRY